MQPGDRVMVYDSPGHPLDHYLYANVLAPVGNGALVQIDHPGNASHAQQKFAPADKILRKADVERLQQQTKARMASENDAQRRAELHAHVKGLADMADQLSE